MPLCGTGWHGESDCAISMELVGIGSLGRMGPNVAQDSDTGPCNDVADQVVWHSSYGGGYCCSYPERVTGIALWLKHYT